MRSPVSVGSELSARADEASGRTGAALALVAVAALLWSSGGLIVRSLDVAGTWTTVFYRSLSATAFLVGFVAIRDRRRAVRSFTTMGRPGLLVAVCFATASISLVVALSMTSVANALVIMSTSPLLAAALGRVWLGEVVRPRTWVAALATVLGVAVMVGGSTEASSLLGDLIALLMPLGLATATVTIRRNQGVLMVPAMAAGTFIAMMVSIPFVTTWTVSGDDLTLLLAFGSVQLGVGLVLYAVGARRLPPASVALVALIEPVFGPLWVWGLLGEFPGRAALAGGTVVLAAVAVHTATDLRQRTVAPTA